MRRYKVRLGAKGVPKDDPGLIGMPFWSHHDLVGMNRKALKIMEKWHPAHAERADLQNLLMDNGTQRARG